LRPPLLAALRRQAPDRYGRLVGRLGLAESYGIAFEKGNPLRALVDRALADLQANGTLATLEKRWLGTNMAKLPVLR
jgi:ABC-type amino acid transport substrate-binding protein